MKRFNNKKKITKEKISNYNFKEVALTKMAKRQLFITLLSILGVTVVSLGSAYAVFTSVSKSAEYNVIKVGTLNIDFGESSNTINLSGQYPMSDEEGIKLTPYTFTITNTGSIAADYEIFIEDDQDMINQEGCSNNQLSKDYIRYKLDTGNPANLSSIAGSNYRIATGTLDAGSSVSYTLYVWIREGVGNDVLNKHYHGKIVVEGENVTREENAPELDSGMIAVTYNGSSWIKADSNSKDWYDYSEQRWANAVTVTSSSRSTYQSAAVGTEISMDDIETMWVWIPRYSYTIGSEDGTNYYGKQGEFLDTTPTQELPGEIDIKFVDTSTKDRGTAKYIVSNGIEDNSWYTPDAFTFGDQELSGIWVGKFETSSSNPSASNGGDNTTSLDAMIKPNVTSWRKINVSNAFTVSQKMNDSGNRYGFTSSADTHMMKNSEWAIVAYLSQSKYGKLGNDNFSGANKEVYQNKSDQYITGCSLGKPSSGTSSDYGCQYTYDVNVSGTGASTTGNIYGVYDMSGGAWDYVMSNYNDVVGSSGFSSMPGAKYYDKYTTSDVSTACNGRACLSHGLSETVGWYNDRQNMIDETSYWMLCGGSHGDATNAGIFSYSRDIGATSNSGSFRLVISMNT